MAAVILPTVAFGTQNAFAGNKGAFTEAFNPETAAGFTNTFTTTDILNPKCPNGLAGTPGSDPANKVLNTALNSPSSFTSGGVVHYTYTDNPHGSAFGFRIQDCEVVYPPNFFQASDFNPTTGVLTNPNISKSTLDSGGTMVDGAELSGISNPEGQIYFSWTVQPAAPGTWVCNFARDINTDHGGGGNRKVTPTCFQIAAPTPKPVAFLGYADSFRLTPGVTTPSPWKGGTNVTFVGCADPANVTACGGDPGFDAGAIRLDNTSGSTMTVSSGSVTIGPCVYAPWSTLPVTVPAGGTLILTETGTTTPPPGCGDIGSTPHDNFDTSEANEAIAAGCVTPNNVVPQISLTVQFGAGSPNALTYMDTAKVLTTGGIDRGTCGGANETTNWVPLP